MEITKNEVIKYINDCEDFEILVQILELTAHKSGVKTISAQARASNKSPNGIRQSKAYRKIMIGEQLMCIPNLRDNDLSWL